MSYNGKLRFQEKARKVFEQIFGQKRLKGNTQERIQMS